MRDLSTDKQPSSLLLDGSVLVSTLQALVESNEALKKEIQALREEVKTIKAGEKFGDWLTPKEAMEYMKVKKTTFEHYRWKAEIKLPHVKRGGKVLFHRPDLDKYNSLYAVRD